MAFGKDRDVLAKRVTNLREAGNATRGRPRGTGGGGTWQRFIDQFKPSTVEADTVRFIPGEYPYTQVNDDGKGNVVDTTNLLLPYHVYTEHFDGRTKKSSTCSGGVFKDYRDKRDTCIGCDIYWETGGSRSERMSRRELNAFTLFNHATFHEVEALDYKTGAVRMNPKTNKPYLEWQKCHGRRCNACTENRPTKKGHLQHYEVGFGHFSQIKEYAKVIGKGCQTCKNQKCVEEVAYLCPFCKDAVIDMSTTHLTLEDIAKMTDGNVSCPHCRQVGLLEEIVECSTPGCSDPVRAGIFDVDITLKKVAGAQGTNASTLMFESFGAICDLDPIYEIKTFDFVKMFEPTPIATQQDFFKQLAAAPTPRQPVPASEVARGYGSGQPSGGGSMFNK